MKKELSENIINYEFEEEINLINRELKIIIKFSKSIQLITYKISKEMNSLIKENILKIEEYLNSETNKLSLDKEYMDIIYALAEDNISQKIDKITKTTLSDNEKNMFIIFLKMLEKYKV